MSAVVDTAVATDDVNAWLDKQHVTARKRDEKQKEVDELIKCVEYGEVSFDDDGNIVQHLSFPIKSVAKLTYKYRITVDDISAKTRNTASNDIFGIVAAYIASATKEAIGVVRQLDNADLSIAQNIVAFF